MRESAENRHDDAPRIEEDADYFKRLGVPRHAARKEIEAAFRKLSKQFHPDTENGDAATMKLITEAWNELKNDAARSTYRESLDKKDAAIHAAAHEAQQDVYTRARGMKEDMGGRENSNQSFAAAEEAQQNVYKAARGMKEDVGSGLSDDTDSGEDPEDAANAAPEELLNAFARERGYQDFESYIRGTKSAPPNGNERLDAKSPLDQQREKLQESLERLGMQARITCFAILYNTFVLPFTRTAPGKGMKNKREFDPAAQVVAGAVDSTFAVGFLAMRILMTSGRLTLFGITKLRHST